MRRMPFLSLLPVLALSACGVGGSNITEVGVDTAEERTVTIQGQPVRLGGRMSTTRQSAGLGTIPRHDITVTLNGQTAATGTVDYRSGGTLAGTWRTSAVAAACPVTETVNRASRRFDCAVVVSVASPRAW